MEPYAKTYRNSMDELVNLWNAFNEHMTAKHKSKKYIELIKVLKAKMVDKAIEEMIE